MGVPEYYYARPRLENLIPDDVEQKGSQSWSLFPQSLYEFITTSLFVGSVGGLNIKLNSRPVPGYKGLWRFIPAYALGLYVARWTDKASIRKYSYEDKIVREYMDLYPEKFPEYKVKTLKETFDRWTPIRSGSATPLSVWTSMGKKEETEHFVPTNSERNC